MSPQADASSSPELVSQFDTFVKSHLQASLANPMSASGSELVLWTKGSYGEATVAGAKSVTVNVRASACPDKSPLVGVSVDGKDLGTQTVTSLNKYEAHVYGSSLAAGNHKVRVTLFNDGYVKDSCDVNAYVASVSMGSTASADPAPTSDKPGPSNTGVPAGTSLSVHQGDLVVTRDGTVLDALDIRGNLLIKANNVTVTRTLVRGGPVSTNALALVEAWWGYQNIKISDSTLRADNFSLMIDGLSGSNITATRLNISNVVDTVKVIGPNFTVQNSWLHDTFYSDHDPHQSSGTTHDDNVQVEGGTNIVIRRNTMTNAHNAAVMVTQNNRVTKDLRISDNWISGGACSINMTQRANGGPIMGSTISGNRFGAGTYGNTCPMLIPSTSPVSINDNVWDATGAPAGARRF